MTNPAKSIRIGTMIDATRGGLPDRIAELAPLGFESFQPMFWQSTRGQNLAELGKRSLDAGAVAEALSRGDTVRPAT